LNKRVLMIAFYYYPHSSSGPHRPVRFAKYLPEFGWVPTVLTVDWTQDNSRGLYDPALKEAGEICEVVRVPLSPAPSRTVRSRLRFISERLMPYRSPFWFGRRMLARAVDLVRQVGFDAIWSTYGPGLDHYVADALSRRFGIPWVADFRDLPDQMYDTWDKRWAVRAEVCTCASASALVAVNQWSADRLASRHKAPVHAIPNGYEPADFPPVGSHRSEKFTIAYFGAVYTGRDPRPVLEALDLLVERQAVDLEDVQVVFHTPFGDSARADPPAHLREFRCGRAVTWSDWVPYAEMVKRQQEATVLLLLTSPGALGVTPGKVFGYLASRRPILSVPSDNGVVDALLAETGGGCSASAPGTIAQILQGWYEEWKRTGTVVYRGQEKVISRYSGQSLTRHLAGVLDEVVGQGRPSGGGLAQAGAWGGR